MAGGRRAGDVLMLARRRRVGRDLGDGARGEAVDDGGVDGLLDLASMAASARERRDLTSTSSASVSAARSATVTAAGGRKVSTGDSPRPLFAACLPTLPAPSRHADHHALGKAHCRRIPARAAAAVPRCCCQEARPAAFDLRQTDRTMRGAEQGWPNREETHSDASSSRRTCRISQSTLEDSLDE
jgi:hypothetical protein